MPGIADALPAECDATFRALAEQELLGVGQASVDGALVFGNPRLCALLGCSLAELRRFTLSDLQRPDWITSVSPVRDGSGEVRSQLVIVQDATPRRRLERQSAFFEELDLRLAAARGERDMLRVALERLAGLIGSSRLCFVEWHEAEGRVRLTASWPQDEQLLPPRECTLDEVGGVAWWRALTEGESAAPELAAQLPERLFGGTARSYAARALDARAGWRVALIATDRATRHWRRDELSLLGAVLARTWPLVERARAEETLGKELRAVQALLVQPQADGGRVVVSDELVTRITAESERRRRLYETTLSNTPDLIYVFDLNHRFTYANAALLDTWGRSWDDVVGKTCLEVGYPEWQAAAHDTEIERVIATKRSVRGEVPFRGGEGERIHDYIFVPVLGEGGEVEAIAGTTRDVTELKQAQFLLAGQAAVLELMVKGAPLKDVLEALCDVVDQQATGRRRACIMLAEDGRQLRVAAGRHMPLEWLESAGPWPIAAMAGSCGTAAYRREAVLVSDVQADPRWEPWQGRAKKHGFRSCWSTPFFSSDGLVLGTFDLYYDRVHQPTALETSLVEIITRTAGVAVERQRAEEELDARTQRQRLLWEAATVMLTTEEPEAMLRECVNLIAPHLDIDVCLNHMVTDVEGGLELRWSLGLDEAMLPELAMLEHGHECRADMERSYEPFAHVFIQESAPDALPLLKRLGLRSYVSVPMLAGGLLGTLAFGSRRRDQFRADEIEFMRTVTSYVTVAHERLRLVEELCHADRKKDDFIALLAHELRNPLAPLRNGLHVLGLSAPDSPAAGRARAIMERQLTHMVRLIDDLLDISRITLNKLELRREDVNLADVIESAVETARPAVDRAEHELEVILPETPVLLHADLTRLAQVVSNLLTNAVKYTPKGGRIRLSAQQHAEHVTISVEDNGIGLAASSLRTIFGMFSQVERGLERSSGGLGIGLALVKGLTEMHGGSVRAESAGPGLGSRFEVCLPIAGAASAVRSDTKSAIPPQVPRRLLVVDDNRDAAESTATVLRLSGNEVHTAYDGLEAVQQVEALRPDVVLMDIGMPRLNGFDATRRIRNHSWGAGIVIIALTGWGQDSDRRQSRAAGFDAHLVKPVDFNQLSALISELCEGNRAAAS